MPDTPRTARTLSAGLIMAVLLACPSHAQTPAAAAAAAADSMPGLRGVMQQLGRHMQAVAGAIATEDWPQVAKLASQVADHPEPPITEKVRVLSWLGTDAVKFRGFDQRVGAAAGEMGDAAKRGDGPAVIAAFAKVQQACLGCHQGYRASFKQHFGGGR